MEFRKYQSDMVENIHAAHGTHQNVMAQLATGGGKTVIFSKILSDAKFPTAAIAHRQELVGQISGSLANFGLQHRIVAPDNVIRQIVAHNTREFGESFYHPNAPCGVAGVDTLVRRRGLDKWADNVGLWVMDEGHHLLADNKWGRAANLFPNAKGLAVTATPVRADGRSLSRNGEGIIDHLVCGPGMRELINDGYLTDYRIFAPPSDLRVDDLSPTATGDVSRPKMAARAKRSHIVGDVVEHYLRIAPGKLGVTFCTDVETATRTASEFNSRGVPAEVVHAGTSGFDRNAIIDRFRRRELLQLVNVDLFGEGFDLPALEVVSMARPTFSYSLYAQQFGRGLRPSPGKQFAIIIDHVGNVRRHGLPDAPRQWDIEPVERQARKKPRAPSEFRTCTGCTALYSVYLSACPYCSFPYIPAERATPQQVDGDLVEMDPEALAELRGEVAAAVKDPESVGEALRMSNAPEVAILGAMANVRKQRDARGALRSAMADWAGHWRALGEDDGATYRRFYVEFGVDVLNAQIGSAADFKKLTEKLETSTQCLKTKLNQRL